MRRRPTHIDLGRMHAVLLRCEVERQPLSVIARQLGCPIGSYAATAVWRSVLSHLHFARWRVKRYSRLSLLTLRHYVYRRLESFTR